MFKVEDKVKTLAVESRTDYANKIYANRNATVIEICHPFGLHTQYKVKFDEPFNDHGYAVENHYYYDWENGLVLRD